MGPGARYRGLGVDSGLRSDYLTAASASARGLLTKAMTMAKSSGGGSMLAGLTNKSPKGDSGMMPPKGSVNDVSVRSSTAKNQSPQGPRTA